VIIKGDTLQELSGKLGIKSEALEKTLSAYNQFCDAV
jgi:hypothetical protein